MYSQLYFKNKYYQVDLNQPIDISIPLQGGSANLKAWYCDAPEISPVMNEFFTGSVALGGPVNFNNIYFNPHAHGTHTECYGHISKDRQSVTKLIRSFQMPAILLSVEPVKSGEDYIIQKNQLSKIEEFIQDSDTLIIRTLPNSPEKKHFCYSNTNPPYFDERAIQWLVSLGINHILVDLPSLDKEVDGGALRGHHIFWNYPEEPRTACSITEFVYIDNQVHDGLYWLQLGISAFDNDAAPSRPILYPII